ncbi:hypothetical protein EMPG_14875 [Blastomyces silverae]|uniref:Uncharacterized protein n=1 Tax=Blastomyces silverae TaxID=2060906 RepID=A0A0H1BF99_9EURO|nr:hypothetical protein EMPG_14875 [Blastomyces silverae]
MLPAHALCLFPAGLLHMRKLISNVRDFGIWFIVYHPISILCRYDRRRRIHKRPVCQECSLQTPVSRRVTSLILPYKSQSRGSAAFRQSTPLLALSSSHPYWL